MRGRLNTAAGGAPGPAARMGRALLGLALLPLCAAMTRVLIGVMADAAHGARFWEVPSPFWGLAIGFGLWLALYFLLPRPVRAYVLAHELTHAFWALLLGDRVGDLRVSRRGGSVRVSRRRFLVLVAPYFFPLYTLLTLAAYGIASLFGDPTPNAPFWMAAIGFTWGFHLTFTISMLAADQSDIRLAGALLAYTTIYLVNVAGVALWMAAITPVGVSELGERLGRDLRTAARTLRELAIGVSRGGAPRRDREYEVAVPNSARERP